jgi:hypothetical protein
LIALGGALPVSLACTLLTTDLTVSTSYRGCLSNAGMPSSSFPLALSGTVASTNSDSFEVFYAASPNSTCGGLNIACSTSLLKVTGDNLVHDISTSLSYCNSSNPAEVPMLVFKCNNLIQNCKLRVSACVDSTTQIVATGPLYTLEYADLGCLGSYYSVENVRCVNSPTGSVQGKC